MQTPRALGWAPSPGSPSDLKTINACPSPVAPDAALGSDQACFHLSFHQNGFVLPCLTWRMKAYLQWIHLACGIPLGIVDLRSSDHAGHIFCIPSCSSRAEALPFFLAATTAHSLQSVEMHQSLHVLFLWPDCERCRPHTQAGCSRRQVHRPHHCQCRSHLPQGAPCDSQGSAHTPRRSHRQKLHRTVRHRAPQSHSPRTQQCIQSRIVIGLPNPHHHHHGLLPSSFFLHRVEGLPPGFAKTLSMSFSFLPPLTLMDSRMLG